MSDERTGGSEGVLPLQRLAGWGLRGFAILTGLAGLLASGAFWTLAQETWQLPWPTISLVVLQILFAIAILAWAGLLWRRAQVLGALETRDYPAITCVVVCIRLMGELLAIGFVLFSLAFAVLSLTTVEPLASNAVVALGLNADRIEPAGWMLAVLLAALWPLAGLFAAGMALFGTYLFADAMTAMLEYVRDVRRIRETLASSSAK
ncbi:hypothetical protein [Thioalkalivibrio sp. AKL19]|uniref:hypothetical protein n=1 Tax=Thioalkalivibrio sp. AKL19 TaxID=1266914 RepID=UPI000462CCF8|nr:hypothetical protein [Thioalkalivibrio sp. AKL19]